MRTKPFLMGVSRSIDLGSTINKRAHTIPKSLKVSDSRAIGEDWKVVGVEIRRATNGYGKQVRNRITVKTK